MNQFIENSGTDAPYEESLIFAYPNPERVRNEPPPRVSDSVEIPPVRSALELYDKLPDEGETLIGNRFLCRGGGLLLVGPSGVGKSTFTAGMCAAFAKGESYLGITCSKAFKILVVQAENDDGDLGEQLRGAFGKFINDDDRDAMENNLKFVTVDHLSGGEFLKSLEMYLEAEKPDIAVIDCLSAYLGDSPTEPRALIGFLRNGLTAALRKYKCGCLMVHHTPKTTNQDRSEWNASDRQYGMAGGADIANWMRAGLMLEATPIEGIFRLYATKRGTRIGWSDADGKAAFMKLIRYARPQKEDGDSTPLRWEFADENDIQALQAATSKKKESKACSAEAFLKHLPEGGRGKDSCVTASQLSYRLTSARLCSKDGFKGLCDEMASSGIISIFKIGKEKYIGRPNDIQILCLGSAEK